MNSIWELIIVSAWLMLPAYTANMTPVVIRKLPLFNYRVDFGITFNGRSLFGSHKTWRGLVFGVSVAVLTAYIQYVIGGNGFFASISLLDYSNWITIGLLLGTGALVGDLVKSMIKRQFSIREGLPFIPWDQLDFTLGGLIGIVIIYVPQPQIILTILIISPLLHIATNHVAYYTHIRNEKW